MMSMSRFACVLCHHPRAYEVAPCVREGDAYQIQRCEACGHVQLFPVPTDAELRTYYQAETQRKAVHGHLSSDEKRKHVLADTERRIALIQSLTPSEVFDYGAGERFLCDPLDELGIAYTGYDLVSDPDRILPADYCVVTLFHVLEHIPCFAHTIKMCWNILRDHGHLLIEVPNHNDWMIEECPAYAAWHYQQAHIHYFTPETLCAVVQKTLGDACTSWTLEGVQRYSLSNAMHWLSHGVPQTGVPIGWCDAHCTEEDHAYRIHRQNSLTCDTLMMILTK